LCEPNTLAYYAKKVLCHSSSKHLNRLFERRKKKCKKIFLRRYAFHAEVFLHFFPNC
jgi:hypothetical protein